MKNTIKVSIAGISFVFAEDAYKAMKEYLDRLESYYYKKPDGREIINDIEARIAELILSEQESDDIVMLKSAESIIKQLGFPDDIDNDDIQTEDFPRRLYRNPNGAIIGGVCSGLGTYFNGDPVWFRLGIFAPFVIGMISAPFFSMWWLESTMFSLFGTLLLLYAILWIAIPMARNPRQKLEMRGEKITASSIRQSFEDEATKISSDPKRERSASIFADIVYIFGRIIVICVKIVAIFFIVIFWIVIISLIVAIIAALFGGVHINGYDYKEFFDLEMTGINSTVYAALILLAVLIPILTVGHLLFRLIFRSKVNKSYLTTSGIIWTILVIYLALVTLRNTPNIREGVKNMIEYIDSDAIEHHHDVDDWDEALWNIGWGDKKEISKSKTIESTEKSSQNESSGAATSEDIEEADKNSAEQFNGSENVTITEEDWDESEWKRKWNND